MFSPRSRHKSVTLFNYIKNINPLEGLIPIVDISLSMGCTYFNFNRTQRNFFFKKKSILNALGLGIIICEKSRFWKTSQNYS